MRVLLMGGTLFNGLALMHELVRQGHDVTICNRGRTEADLPAGVNRLIADRSDPASVRAAIGGQDWDCVQDMTAYHPEDVELMVDVLSGHCGHYIFASSTVIYAPSGGRPMDESHPVDRSDQQNEYGFHKILCEDVLFAQDSLPCTSAAFSMVFGPHNALPHREQRMFARLLAGRPVLIPGDGSTTGCVGHVDDQARALEMMMGRDVTFGKRYNLTGDDPYSDSSYVDVFEAVTGTTADRRFVPSSTMDDLWDSKIDVTPGQSKTKVTMDIRSSDEARKQAARFARFNIMSMLIQRLAPNIHRWDSDVVFTVDRLKDDLGWAPQHTMESMVADTFRWWTDAGLQQTQDHNWQLEDQILALL